MEFVGVLGPAVADVGAVVHVGDEDVFGAGVDLGLGLLHGLAEADDDENDAGSAGDEPLAVDVFYVFDVNAFELGFLKTMALFLEKDSKVASSSKGNGGTTMRMPI